jgi:hypothetical protein
MLEGSEGCDNGGGNAPTDSVSLGAEKSVEGE